jgi:hypothetical protein
MNYLQFEMLGRQRRQQLLAEADNERLTASLRAADKPNQANRLDVAAALAQPRLAGQPG